MNQDFTILAQGIAQTLRSRPCGLVLDIDGTIAPIARRPEYARVSPACRHHIAALAGSLDLVAVISGRPVQQARDMLDLDGVKYLGCYGMETWIDGETAVRPEVRPLQEQVQQCAGLLAERLAGRPELEGLLVEDKRFSVTFHYRRCEDHQLARKVILDLLDHTIASDAVKVTEARRAVELVPNLFVNKGTALVSLVRGSFLRGILYVGDDQADIDAFRALKRWRADTGGCGLALAAMGPEAPAELGLEADFTLPGVPGVEGFLHQLRRLVTAGYPSSLSSDGTATEEGPPPR